MSMPPLASPLVAPSALHALIEIGAVVVDCRFDLADPSAGRRAWCAAHIPGAAFADLETDLSGPPVTDRGRHPLPTPEALCECFGALGIGSESHVVAYDGADGAFAARLWWLLRYMGHERVQVLDGGFAAWTAAGLPVAAGPEQPSRRDFRGAPRTQWLVRRCDVPSAARLVDARDPARYRGEIEPIDPVAGHIPGARNRFYRDNVRSDGTFLPPNDVRAGLQSAFDGVHGADVVHYCGSGVTACHNLLAAAHAGLAPGRLYAGSWSDWCRDPSHSVADDPL